MTVEAEDACMAKRSSVLAEYMLVTKYWEKVTDVKMT
jgi:hypothetical protein